MAVIPDADVDIVIVGAGPTGLLSAVLSQHLGLEVAIFDAKIGPLEVGRADALNARTQQYLEVVGVLSDLLPQGIRCSTSTTFADGEFKSRQSHWWTGLKHTFHPNFLMLGQPVIESALSARLQKTVHYSEPVVHIYEGPERVIVATAKRTVRAKFVIGSDGARSSVRALMGIPFTGTKPNMVWTVLDTFIDTDFPTCSEIITFQLNGESRVSWIPRERGLARFYILLEGERTLQRAEASIRAHLAPHRIDFVETEWFSEFEIKERVAESFITNSGIGRVILAGDAAHVHAVNGGQGLNTGIADAFNLIWRLAWILKHPELLSYWRTDILRSYEIERQHTAQEVIDVAAKLVRKTLHTASDYVSIIEKSADYITGMGVSYAGLSSPLVRDSQLGIFKAGDRLPDLWVVDSMGVSSRFYSMFSYGKFVLLLVGDWKAPSVPLPNSVNVLTVRSANTGALGGEFVGPSWVKAGDDYAVLVRPDMYVEFVANKEDVIQRFIERLRL